MGNTNEMERVAGVGIEPRRFRVSGGKTIGRNVVLFKESLRRRVLALIELKIRIVRAAADACAQKVGRTRIARTVFAKDCTDSADGIRRSERWRERRNSRQHQWHG